MGACTAVFVQHRLAGGWNVWQGSTQNDDPMPSVDSRLHFGVFADRGRALCEAHDRAEGLPVESLPDERVAGSVVVTRALLLLARDCAEWHIEDGDECGTQARAVVYAIDAALKA